MEGFHEYSCWFDGDAMFGLGYDITFNWVL